MGFDRLRAPYHIPPPARSRTGAHLLGPLVKIGALTATAPGASSVNAHTSASSRSGLSDMPGTQA